MTRLKRTCLRPGEWLNDDVKNMRMSAMQERDDELCLAFPERKNPISAIHSTPSYPPSAGRRGKARSSRERLCVYTLGTLDGKQSLTSMHAVFNEIIVTSAKR